MDQPERPRGSARVPRPASGLGVPCREAQADGVPCPDPGSRCGDCDRVRPVRQMASEGPPRGAPRLARQRVCVNWAMRELRFHGRGGQGTVIASKILAVALFREGRQVQSFPAFGVERRGAPVTAFLRVDDRPILLRCEITEPDDLVVLDPTLIGALDVTAGLKPGGLVLINSPHPPEWYRELTERFRVATVDASAIALRLGLGTRTQPIVNTAILGAFASSSGWVGLESVCDAIREEVPLKADANVEAARAAAEAVRRSQREAVHV